MIYCAGKVSTLDVSYYLSLLFHLLTHLRFLLGYQFRRRFRGVRGQELRYSMPLHTNILLLLLLIATFVNTAAIVCRRNLCFFLSDLHVA